MVVEGLDECEEDGLRGGTLGRPPLLRAACFDIGAKMTIPVRYPSADSEGLV